MKDCKKTMIKWLNRAYAMEVGMKNTIESHAKLMEDMPDMKQKIENHIRETQMQMEKVENAIKSLGGDVSLYKKEVSDITTKLSGFITEQMHGKEKVLLNAISDHATEHYEMAIYKTIAEIAKMCNDPDVQKVAKDIMKEETETGEELSHKLSMLVKEYMQS